MASCSEHVDIIRAALAAAYEDGYKPSLWLDYDRHGDPEVIYVELIQLRRKDGWMQIAERADLVQWEL